MSATRAYNAFKVPPTGTGGNPITYHHSTDGPRVARYTSLIAIGLVGDGVLVTDKAHRSVGALTESMSNRYTEHTSSGAVGLR